METFQLNSSQTLISLSSHDQKIGTLFNWSDNTSILLLWLKNSVNIALATSLPEKWELPVVLGKVYM